MGLVALPTTVFADGGTSPYSPYGGHNPVDTALGGSEDLLIIAGIALYIIGLVLIVYGKKLKQLLIFRKFRKK